MIRISSPSSVPPHSVLALGNFDGVHTAHRALLKCAKETAQRLCVPFGVYTFGANTKKTLGISGYAALTTPGERAALIEKSGADFLYEEDFATVRDLPPEAFCNYLSDTLHVGTAVCGDDFRFGKAASGDADTLAARMPAVVVPTLYHQGQAVSSSMIRACIREGDVKTAALLLGYPYFIETKVIHGQSLGHTLGFPTINQMLYGDKLSPKRGVYCVSVCFDGQTYNGVCNVGVRPTVCGEDSDTVVFETNIIGFEGDLYGKTVRVSFCSYLRGECRFPSVEALRVQVMRDIEDTKRYFEEQ